VFNQLSGGKVVAWDPTTFDGSHIVAGILLDNVNATAADLAGVLIGRDAVVQKSQLQWGAAITAGRRTSRTRTSTSAESSPVKRVQTTQEN
jgi:hypothetical protein